jgi:hypothetical protein
MATHPDQPGRRPEPGEPGHVLDALGAPTAGAVTRSNLLAGIAPLVGLLGLVIGAYGILSLAGLVISIIGLALTRRIEGRDARSGRSAALLGLLFSLLGLLRWLPVLLALVPGLDDGLTP